MFLPSSLIKAYPIRSDHNNYKPIIQITSLPSSYFGNKKKKKQKNKRKEECLRGFYQAGEMPMTPKRPKISQKWAERLSNWAMQIDLLLAGWTRKGTTQAGADGDHGEEEEVKKQWQWCSIYYDMKGNGMMGRGMFNMKEKPLGKEVQWLEELEFNENLRQGVFTFKRLFKSSCHLLDHPIKFWLPPKTCTVSCLNQLAVEGRWV